MGKEATNGKGRMAHAFGWMERFLRLESRYGFFALIRTIFVLLLLGITLFIITNPRYFVERMEGYVKSKHDAAVTRRLVADARVRILLTKLLSATGGGSGRG